MGSEANIKGNVYKIKKDGRDKLVEYTKLTSNSLWYCARCVNAIEKSDSKGAYWNTFIRNLKAKLRRIARLERSHSGKGKTILKKRCPICNWYEGSSLTDAQRKA